jgi:hypothetical protein
VTELVIFRDRRSPGGLAVLLVIGCLWMLAALINA